MAAIFISNCNVLNGRMEYIEKLKGHNITVDVYGRCGTLSCPMSKQNSCFEMLKKTYKFYLAFESDNCRGYITEKLFVNALG